MPGDQRLNLTRIIAGQYDDWTVEDPRGQKQAAIDKNAATGGLYIQATRVIKAWNLRFPTARPLKSYHAEALLYHALTGPCTYAEAVVAFFDYAYQQLAPYTKTLVPGSSDRYVDDMLSEEDRATAREKVEKAREKAHTAAETDDPYDAMEAWTKVFGTAFPAPSTDPDNVQRAATNNSLRARGAGVAAVPTGPLIIPARSWTRP